MFEDKKTVREDTAGASIETLRGAKTFPNPLLASHSGVNVPTRLSLVLHEKTNKHRRERDTEKSPSPSSLSRSLRTLHRSASLCFSITGRSLHPPSQYQLHSDRQTPDVRKTERPRSKRANKLMIRSTLSTNTFTMVTHVLAANCYLSMETLS